MTRQQRRPTKTNDKRVGGVLTTITTFQINPLVFLREHHARFLQVPAKQKNDWFSEKKKKKGKNKKQKKHYKKTI